MEIVGHDDLQGRSAYQPLIINQNGRQIAYVGHHDNQKPIVNPMTGKAEINGTSVVDVTDPARPKYLTHIASGRGGAQMVRVCSGDTLPKGVKGKWYLLRPYGNSAHELYDVTDPAKPSKLVTIVDGLRGTHKSWWECDTGIAYLVANKREEGWHGGNHLKIYDLSDPAKPVYIRDFGMVGTQPGASASEEGEGIHGAISAGPEKKFYPPYYGKIAVFAWFNAGVRIWDISVRSRCAKSATSCRRRTRTRSQPAGMPRRARVASSAPKPRPASARRLA
jgi:hypothetical protein